jgi:hypothetical protein
MTKYHNWALQVSDAFGGELHVLGKQQLCKLGSRQRMAVDSVCSSRQRMEPWVYNRILPCKDTLR